MYCEVFYKTTGERWGIFPRDIGEFQARLCRPDSCWAELDGEVLEKSVSIEIMSCSFWPDAKNKRHRKALTGLAGRLAKSGWQQLDECGSEWYSLRFYKPVPEEVNKWCGG